MRCDYKDGFRVDYSGSLRITEGDEVDLVVKGAQIPANFRSNLDAAASHNSCGELRAAAQADLPRLSHYDADGRIDYEKVRRTAKFQSGRDRLWSGAKRYTVAMMCGEADPLECHRGLMITPALGEWGVFPLHLRATGGRHDRRARCRRRRPRGGLAGIGRPAPPGRGASAARARGGREPPVADLR